MPIVVHNISCKMLSKVIQYVQYHLEAKESGKSEEEVKNWDRQFVDVDQPTLYDVLMVCSDILYTICTCFWNSQLYIAFIF